MFKKSFVLKDFGFNQFSNNIFLLDVVIKSSRSLNIIIIHNELNFNLLHLDMI